MGFKYDLTGKVFGRLTVVGFAGNTRRNRSLWNCVCECGKHVVARSDNLKDGSKQSCGCLNSDIKSAWCKERNTKHGLSKERLYRVWVGMRKRCYCETDVTYKNYGARGIRICEEWREDFSMFYKWAIENGYDASAPRGECTIDRIDFNGHYSPENCRIINNFAQASNKRNNKWITHNGMTKTQSEWARFYGKNRAFFCGSSELVERRMNGCDEYRNAHGNAEIPAYTRCTKPLAKGCIT